MSNRLLSTWRWIPRFTFGCLLCWGSSNVSIADEKPRAERGIYIVRADGTNLRELSPEAGRYYGSPVWSPDGKRIAYDSWAAPSDNFRDAHSFHVGLEGGEPMDLGPGAMPSWSPDEQHLAFHTYGQASGIWTATADGTERRQVVPSMGCPRFHPTSGDIACLEWGQNIVLVNRKTGAARRLLESGWRPEIGYQWSPTGDRICFVRFADESRVGGMELVIAQIDPSEETGDLTIRSQAPHFFTNVSWSPDGKRVLCAIKENDEDPFQVHVLDVASDEAPIRLTWQESTTNNVAASWSPDGKWIVFASYK